MRLVPSTTSRSQGVVPIPFQSCWVHPVKGNSRHHARNPSMTMLAVAIVNANTREHLRACLASVKAEAPPEVVVVDSGSVDGSVAMVQAEYPGVRVLANSVNPGY